MKNHVAPTDPIYETRTTEYCVIIKSHEDTPYLLTIECSANYIINGKEQSVK
jgi:hypothetical protein